MRRTSIRRIVSALVLLAMTAPAFAAEPTIEESPFGTANGTPIKKFTLSNGTAKVAIITYGGIVTNLWVPDKDGKLADVVMGFDTLDGYLAGHPYFGSNVGRCGNRIANAKFSLTIEPENEALQARAREVEAKRARGETTLPTRIDVELATNPFLRAHSPAIRQRLRMEKAQDWQVFGEVRERKNMA